MKAGKAVLIPLIATTLVGWVLTALTEKSKRPVFIKKPAPLPKDTNYPLRERAVAVPTSWSPSSNSYFASFPGWRRAGAGEVTIAMRNDAVAALSHPLKSIIDRPDYRIVLETHYNDTKGEHKGATIFKRVDV